MAFETDYDTPPAPEVRVSSEKRHNPEMLEDVTHVVVQ